MSLTPPSAVVSIHPYFRVHSGKMEDFKALIREFVERTAAEAACLNYEFTVDGDLVFCREAYIGGAGAAAHLENVGDLVARALEISTLERFEMHGPAADLEPLRGPLAALSPRWFIQEAGFWKAGLPD